MARTVQLLKADIRASLVTNQIWEFCYSYDYDDNSDDDKDVADADHDDNNFVFYFEVQTNYVKDLQTSFILRILFLHKLWHSHRRLIMPGKKIRPNLPNFFAFDKFTLQQLVANKSGCV